MHIKKLEISGFKSFVDRTVVHFDHDVVGVVGPNGCGKSNIVDAIRWCMGEQSARQLRGKAMEDVIFNGSETRGPSSLAEVTLTFDNTDPVEAATLPIEYREYAEIAVTRRLFRDGTSQYLINKVDVRLKDVVDIFLGTGVGSKAYSIVEQGKIGLIVSARPEDRRTLIEEAAGITKYKSRKKAAERKMELTQQNLLRVGDRVAELERSVASLARQAAKAERYVSYRNELEHLVLHAASHQLLEVLACEKFAVEEKADAEAKAGSAHTELGAAEAALEVDRAEAMRLEAEAEASQRDAITADNDVRALEADGARTRDRLQNLSERSRKLRDEMGELRGDAVRLVEERDQVAGGLAELEAAEANEAGAALMVHERLESLRAEQQAADEVVSELRRTSAGAQSQIAGAKAKLAGLDRRASEMASREKKQDEELEQLRDELGKLEAKRSSVADEIETLQALGERSAEERTRLEESRAVLRQAFADSERALEIERANLAQQSARLRALEEMRERLEGVGDGVRNLVAKGDPTLRGLFVDRVDVPDSLTAAVAAALGPALESVVVADPARAVELLAELASSKGGRATVLPEGVTAAEARPFDALAGEVQGRLSDLVHCADSDRTLVEAIAGDILVVDTTERAMALRGRAAGFTLVSRDGTVVHPDGRISGGSADAVASELVAEQREVRALRETCSELRARVDSRVQEHAELREQLNEVASELDEARQRAHESELSLVAAQKDERRTAEQVGQTERRITALEADLAEMRQGLAESDRERAEAAAVLETQTALLTEAEGQLEMAVATASEWKAQVASQLSIVTDQKVRLARVREQAEGARATALRLGRSIDELEGRIQRHDTELTRLAQETGESAASLVTNKESLLAAVLLARQAHERLDRARIACDGARAALGEREGALKDLRARTTEAAEKLTAVQLSLEKLALKKEHVLSAVQERFRGLDLSRVLGDYHRLPVPDAAHSDRIAELTRLIDRIGPVNLDATREHEEEKKRFDFFTEQKLDLEKALADLNRAIAQMNRESRKLFADTFEAVNTRFKTLFPKMFRGGRAELMLTNPEDLLETGIEIIAQPPGKKLGNIELMSGGEKALTAVSLIFALFQFKPSPFCILDEVDAPLDEANVTRYNELIREMTDRSQFILITHIKKTMQSVDVLYGVTMQEPGISRLVSVKVNETVQRHGTRPGAQQVAVA